MGLLNDFLNPIEYLTRKKFPDYHKVKSPPVPGMGGLSMGGVTAEYRKERMEQITAFHGELLAMSKEALAALVASEREQDREAHLAKLAGEEAARFFNWSNATADFSHWSKMAHWTLDEAIALSFGKAPERVNWENVKPHVGVSPFALQYSRVRDLALRAMAWKQVFDPVLPSIFLGWARRTEIDVPAELLSLIERRGIVISDWKDLYNKLQTRYDAVVANQEKAAQAINELIAQRDFYKNALAELQANPWQGFDENADNYPQELDIAMQAWHAVSGNRDGSMTVKEQLADWIEPRFKQLSAEAIKRTSTICNWEKDGGRPKKD